MCLHRIAQVPMATQLPELQKVMGHAFRYLHDAHQWEMNTQSDFCGNHKHSQLPILMARQLYSSVFSGIKIYAFFLL